MIAPDRPAVPSIDGTAKITLRALSKHFRGPRGVVRAVEGVSLAIPEGEFCCLVGPSGCGKTTLLRLIAGLERPTGGALEVRRGDATRPATAMVFQGHSVFPWYTVRQNISYGLRFRRLPGRERKATVEALIAKVGLRRFADAYPHQLSEGMRQRVSIARALAADPEVLLMDEPFANLDEQNRLLLQDELLRIWQEQRKTVLFVTHSVDEALVLGDRVVVMTAQPGQIKREVAVPFARPRSPYQVKSDAAFGAHFRAIWEELREEVWRAREEELAGEAGP